MYLYINRGRYVPASVCRGKAAACRGEAALRPALRAGSGTASIHLIRMDQEETLPKYSATT